MTGGPISIPPGTSTASIFAATSCVLGSSLEIFDTATGAIHAFIPGNAVQSAVPLAVNTIFDPAAAKSSAAAEN